MSWRSANNRIGWKPFRGESVNKYAYVITAGSSDYLARPFLMKSMYRELKTEVFPYLSRESCMACNEQKKPPVSQKDRQPRDRIDVLPTIHDNWRHIAGGAAAKT